ncbi:hypothetical protein [Curtobacterium sp. MCSS17_008]|uniref:hypothetical protein n=1 Tax=Curtobacterium sp. MCSS17_008 TaxID=2175647 RepID=UPI0015E8CFFC|nr:hypothetical protein [Curtobacterium sp. MCSS17_008]
MHTTYQSASPTGTEQFHRFGLTHPAVIEAYVSHRVNDPSLLTRAEGPRYADFFAAAD